MEVSPIVTPGEAVRFGEVLELAALRPKNEKRPDLFFSSSTGDSDSLAVSRILQPGGVTSSGATVGLALIEASHEVEPFDAMYMAIGLDRVGERFLVNLRLSDNCFDVNVFWNGDLGGRTKSSGANLCKREELQ